MDRCADDVMLSVEVIDTCRVLISDDANVQACHKFLDAQRYFTR